MIHFDQKQIRIAIVIVAVMVAIIGCYFYKTLQKEEEIIPIREENSIEERTPTNQEIEDQIIVHIAGEVKKPGIIKTTEGARIADIIEEAGGLNEQADITNINLAYPVEDGQKIIIPKIGQEQETITQEGVTSNPGATQETQNIKINLNKASSEELQTLQGIRRIHSRKDYQLSKRKPGILNKLKT